MSLLLLDASSVFGVAGHINQNRFQMSFFRNIYSLAMLVTLMAIGFQGCDIINGKDEDPTPSLSLYPDKSDASPFEQVTITAIDYNFPQESYLATIGGKEITLTRTSSSQLVFTMPFVSGNQVLYLVVDDITYSFDFQVKELEPIANPDEQINTFKQDVEGIINEVEQMIQQGELQIPAEHMQVLQNQKLAFEQLFASATADQKQEVAQFIKANPGFFSFDHIRLQQFNDSLNTSRAFVAWDQQLTDDMRYFTGLVIATGATIGIFNGTLYSGNPFLIGAATLALVTEFVLVFDQTGTMLTRSYKPFEFDLNNELRATVVEFENDIPYQLGIDATYRTLYKNDKESSDVTLELVANINTFTGYWNQVSGLVPGLNGTVENLDDKNGYVTNANRLAVTPEYISIENISNSNVSLSNFSHAGSVNVTFSTNADADQDFTFDIVYKNPDFSEEKLNVLAKLKIEVDSSSIYKESALGNYKVENYQGNGPNSVLYCELLDDGTSEYTIYNDPSWPDGKKFYGNWWIQKQESRYYYAESGFWHYGFPSIEIDFPLQYPVSSFQYHNETVYVKQ